MQVQHNGQPIQRQRPAYNGHEKFSKEDDEQLIQLVQKFGTNWKVIALNMRNRNSRQCRERWMHYLDPQINNSPFSSSEDQLIISKFNEFGPKWVMITKFFHGRTDQQLKNRFQVLKRKGALENFPNQSFETYSEHILLPSPNPSSSPSCLKQPSLNESLFNNNDSFYQNNESPSDYNIDSPELYPINDFLDFPSIEDTFDNLVFF